MTLFGDHSIKELIEAHAPYAISPIPGPKTRHFESLTTTLLGIKVVPDLGILTTSLGAGANVPIVQRSWGLLGGASNYGPNFRYGEYLKARNHLIAILYHFTFRLMLLFLILPGATTLARKFILQPGEGPSKEKGDKDLFEYRGIGVPDIKDSKRPRAFSSLRYEGSIYKCKLIFLRDFLLTLGLTPLRHRCTTGGRGNGHSAE